MMTDSQFRAIVTLMRAKQKEYFKTRSIDVLQQCKEVEKMVDTELKKELTLFEGSSHD